VSATCGCGHPVSKHDAPTGLCIVGSCTCKRMPVREAYAEMEEIRTEVAALRATAQALRVERDAWVERTRLAEMNAAAGWRERDAALRREEEGRGLLAGVLRYESHAINNVVLPRDRAEAKEAFRAARAFLAAPSGGESEDAALPPRCVVCNRYAHAPAMVVLPVSEHVLHGSDPVPVCAECQAKLDPPDAPGAGEAECQPCAGSGKRHSVFDFCGCKPACDGLGVCGNCAGTGRAPAGGKERT
jgi:hypothetical protein